MYYCLLAMLLKRIALYHYCKEIFAIIKLVLLNFACSCIDTVQKAIFFFFNSGSCIVSYFYAVLLKKPVGCKID